MIYIEALVCVPIVKFSFFPGVDWNKNIAELQHEVEDEDEVEVVDVDELTEQQ